MSYIVAPPAVASLPVVGGAQRFPVRRIFCVGRNYADHAREMGVPADRQQPMFFSKPADAVVSDGVDVPYPSATQELHHEVEMVVALGAGGRDLTPEQASGLVWGYGVGLDLTRRDLQAEAKARSHPWDAAKGFDHSAPVSALCPASAVEPGPETVISLWVNDELRQQSRLDDMIFNVPELLSHLSKLFELRAGDLLFTGTPAGVGPLQRGDSFHAELQGIARLDGRIV
ncbi:fumarylacetoacetate hydrolase family protein [Frateuria aurantia]